jgi:hypothetical protein
MRERTQGASTEDAPVTAAAAAPAPKVELRNSLWCVHTASGRIGMINEFHAGAALFHYADADGILETAAVAVPQEELRVAKAAELPANLGFTEQQCKDTGYL